MLENYSFIYIHFKDQLTIMWIKLDNESKNIKLLKVVSIYFHNDRIITRSKMKLLMIHLFYYTKSELSLSKSTMIN